jgi:hypothetical protein
MVKLRKKIISHLPGIILSLISKEKSFLLMECDFLKVLCIFLLFLLLIHLVDFTFQLLVGAKTDIAIDSIVSQYQMMDIAQYVILIFLILIFLISVIPFYKKRGQSKS